MDLFPPEGEIRRCAAVGCTKILGSPYVFCREHYNSIGASLRARLGTGYPLHARLDNPHIFGWVESLAEAVERLAWEEGWTAENPFRIAVEKYRRAPLNRGRAGESNGVAASQTSA